MIKTLNQTLNLYYFYKSFNFLILTFTDLKALFLMTTLIFFIFKYDVIFSQFLL